MTGKAQIKKSLKESPKTRGEIRALFPGSDAVLTRMILDDSLSYDGERFSIQAKETKYHNKKVTIDGEEFDSLKEGRFYPELKMLEKAGAITNLKLHPRFPIADKVSWNGKTLRSRYYEADFQYAEKGQEIVVDVKSEITRKNPVYTLKRQLFLLQYPEYKFVEEN